MKTARDSRVVRACAESCVVALLSVVASCGGESDAARANAVLEELTGPARAPALAQDADEVRIGLFNLEGGGSVSLPMVADAQEAVIAYANDYLGGLADRRIVPVRCGAGDDEASVEACARRFLAEDVVAVVSGQSARTSTLIGALDDAGIVYLGAAVNDTAELGAGNGYFLGPGFLGAMSLWAEAASESESDRIGVLLADTGTESSIEPLMRSLFGGNDLEVTVTPLDGPGSVGSAVPDALAAEPGLLAIVADADTCAAVFAELDAARFAGDVTAIAPCLEETAIGGISAASRITPTVMVPFVTSGSTDETRLFEAVMSRYGGVPRSMFSAAGYATMLTLLRLTAALSAGDEIDATTVARSIRESEPVLAPLGGQGATIDCRTSAFGRPLVRSTVCSPVMYAATVRDGSIVTGTEGLDANVAWSRAFGG